MSRDSHSRAGFGLAELVTAMALGAIVTALIGTALLGQLRLARAATLRADAAEALRTATTVLHGEMRRADATDLRAVARDSIAIRAFRGSGEVCAVSGERMLMRYRGDRLPDPRKDSLLVVSADGAESVHSVADVRYAAAPCPPADGEVTLQVRGGNGQLPVGAVALVFESGMYYISSRAVRYRLGAEGRQPLTAELFVHPGSSFGPAASGIAYAFRTVRGDILSGTARFGTAAPRAP
jgi:hypothetical protein